VCCFRDWEGWDDVMSKTWKDLHTHIYFIRTDKSFNIRQLNLTRNSVSVSTETSGPELLQHNSKSDFTPLCCQVCDRWLWMITHTGTKLLRAYLESGWLFVLHWKYMMGNCPWTCHLCWQLVAQLISSCLIAYFIQWDAYFVVQLACWSIVGVCCSHVVNLTFKSFLSPMKCVDKV